MWQALANAEDAEKLEGMTLSWVHARGRDRDAVRAINAQLKHDTAELWAFEFKANLLRYLARGEAQRCTPARPRTRATRTRAHARACAPSARRGSPPFVPQTSRTTRRSSCACAGAPT